MQKTESQEDFWNLFIKSFSAERLQIYLKLSDGSTKKAQALYLWNAKVSSELWEVVGYIEISLRNAIDLQLTSLSSTPAWISPGNPEQKVLLPLAIFSFRVPWR